MINVALIEDNSIYRECLEMSLNVFPDINVIHVLPNALHIKERFLEQEPDVVLMDISMPGIDGVRAVEILNEHFPHIKCIMLTVHLDMELVIKTMQRGAKGYLLKDKDSVFRIAESIRTLYSGNYNEEFPLNAILAKKLLQHFSSIEESLDQKLEEYHLTQKQKEILKYLYDGLSYKAIAERCSISILTLNSHIKSIYPKLNINSRNQIKNILN